MFNVAYVKNDVTLPVRPIVTTFGTLIQNMNRTGCMTAIYFQIFVDDFMRFYFGIGDLHVKVKY